MNIRRFAAVAEKIKQTYGNHYRALIRLGVPIVIGQMGMIVLSFADTLMIGHHSTQELAAASFVNSLMNLFIRELYTCSHKIVLLTKTKAIII